MMPLRKAAIVLMAAVLASCSSSRPPTAGSGSAPEPGQNVYGPGGGASSGTGAQAGNGDAGRGPDAGDDAGDEDEDPCTTRELTGPLVEELELPFAAPDAMGGAIATGRYDLEQLESFDTSASAPAPTGRKAQISMRVTSVDVRVTELRQIGDATPTRRTYAFSYTVDGDEIVTRELCPVAGRTRRLPFTAAPGGLALQVDSSHRETYARKE